MPNTGSISRIMASGCQLLRRVRIGPAAMFQKPQNMIDTEIAGFAERRRPDPMPQMAAGAIEVNGGGLAVAKEHSILAYRIPLAEPCEHVLGRGGGYSRHRAIIPRFRAACVCAA